MAGVEKGFKTETIERQVPVITLTLSEDEAQYLTTLIGKVGGDPATSSRKHGDAIFDGLEKLGFRSRPMDARGTIYFEDVR